MSDEPKEPQDPDVDEPGPAVEEQDPGEVKGAGKLIPFTRYVLNTFKGKGKQGEEAERLEDGTIVLSNGKGWTRWIFGTFPIQQITCVACLRQRREDDHEGCGFEQCDCFCMQGKHWPLWALFGLKPPDGPLPGQFALSAPGNAGPGTAPRPPQTDAVSAYARHGPPVLFAALTVSTLALAVVAWESFVPVRARHLGTPTVASTSGAPEQVSEQTSATVPALLPLVLETLGGLKMPEKPRAEWLRPGKDGICRNSKTGEELRTQAVIRGSCWFVSRKLPGEPSCPRRIYDPPPELLNDPKQKDMWEDCFQPWTREGGSSLDSNP